MKSRIASAECRMNWIRTFRCMWLWIRALFIHAHSYGIESEISTTKAHLFDSPWAEMSATDYEMRERERERERLLLELRCSPNPLEHDCVSVVVMLCVRAECRADRHNFRWCRLLCWWCTYYALANGSSVYLSRACLRILIFISAILTSLSRSPTASFRLSKIAFAATIIL